MARPSIAAERREEILIAFEACALRKGFAATTLADVADEAGLPRPLVRHFMGNRAEMVTGLIERMVQRASDDIEDALTPEVGLQEEELLQIVLTRLFTDTTTNRLMIQLWQHSWQDTDLQQQLHDVYCHCVEQIHARLVPSDASRSRDVAYALTALGLGNAVLRQFNVQPDSGASLLDAGRLITQLTGTTQKKRKSQ